jgi:hypothetical protein
MIWTNYLKLILFTVGLVLAIKRFKGRGLATSHLFVLSFGVKQLNDILKAFQPFFMFLFAQNRLL